MDERDLESRLLEIGRGIFARINERESLRYPFAHLDDIALNRIVGDQALRTQLFRFVDSLPALTTPRSVARHLGEHLRAAGWRWAPIDGASSPMVARIAQFGVRRLAHRFIIASDLDHAVAALKKLRLQKLAFTVDLLGEAVISEAEANRYQAEYLSLVQYLADRISPSSGAPGEEIIAIPQIDSDDLGPIPRVNVSIKLSSLYSQFDPLDPAGTSAATLERLRPILRLARDRGVFVNLDMEQRAYKDITLAIFKSVFDEPEFRDWRHVGIAMQAYLRDTAADLRELAEWANRRGTPVTVRLVKGAYWDYETVIAAQNGWPVPVFTDKQETDAAFESAAAFLMEQHELLRPAIASHNIRGIAAAIAWQEHFRVPEAAVEFQMLFGMADPIKAALVDMGRRVRVYAPFGPLLPGIAYLVRRLLENTSNESFLRAGFVQHVPEEQLLMRPIPATISKTQAAPTFSNEPPTDFAVEANRAAMASAISKKIETDRPLFIGGKEARGSKWIESINPSHKSKIVGRVAQATVAQAGEAVETAKLAFPGWRATPATERAALLDRVAEILQQRRFELAALEVHECAKPWRDADADVAEAIDYCRYYAMEMRRLAEPHGPDLSGERNRWLHEPRGVAAAISPWNFPLAILCGMSAAAVVTGNPVIMKAAEQSPLTGAALAAAFQQAGAPPGVVNFLPGIGEEIGPALVSHPDVAIIAFTGSRAVGVSINQQAAVAQPGQTHVKRVIVEMGGKNAIIIDDDADMDEAITAVVTSAFGYSGQKCSACSRVIILKSVYADFCARLVEATRSLKLAPAEDPACRIGPVIDAAAFARIHAEIERGTSAAKLLYRGDLGPLAAEGYYIAPHIFADAPPDSRLVRDEIFGPVLTLLPADDLDHALALANGVDYALTGGLFSRSPAHIEHCSREFRVGDLYINRKITGAMVGRQPFGGFKLSGSSGAESGGPDYLRQFTWARCVTENTLRHGFAGEEDGGNLATDGKSDAHG